MKTFVLIAAVIFIGILGALTIDDIITYGLTPLDVLAVMVFALFVTGILGALLEQRRREK